MSIYQLTKGGKFDKISAAFQGHFTAHNEYGADGKKIAKLKQRIAVEGQTADFTPTLTLSIGPLKMRGRQHMTKRPHNSLGKEPSNF